MELSGLRRTGELAGDADIADEPTVGGNEPDNHAIALAIVVGLGIHLNVGVAAGGEEALNARPDVGHAERLVYAERQDVMQLGRLERL